jgi:hypothetical protein
MSNIQKVNCPRCNKEVYTVVRSLTGAESARRKYQGICNQCITPEENEEMMREQANAIIDYGGGKYSPAGRW